MWNCRNIKRNGKKLNEKQNKRQQKDSPYLIAEDENITK